MKSLLLSFLLLLSVAVGASGNANASFRASRVSGTAPMAVFFEPFATASTTYRWDFGNGYRAPDKEPTATYLKPGIYIVKLLVQNGAQTDSSFMSIEVHAREEIQ
jgi:PKD repeat protein